MLLPIGRADERTHQTAWMIGALILANVLVFLLELLGGDDFIAAFAVVPYEITHGVDLIQAVHVRGVGMVPQAPGPAPIYLTLLTAMFLHSGWLHIGGNMLYLWIFGGEIEAVFGQLRFLAFYLVCGLVAFGAQIVSDPDSVIPSLGASGAIAGVMGAYVLLFPRHRIRTLLPLGWLMIPIRLPALVVIGFWLVLQYFDEFIAITEHNAQTRNGGVAYLAHIGGFIAGWGLAFLFRPQLKQPALGD